MALNQQKLKNEIDQSTLRELIQTDDGDRLQALVNIAITAITDASKLLMDDVKTNQITTEIGGLYTCRSLSEALDIMTEYFVARAIWQGSTLETIGAAAGIDKSNIRRKFKHLKDFEEALAQNPDALDAALLDITTKIFVEYTNKHSRN